MLGEPNVTLADPADAGCDCPCHRGGSLFHVVSCCGSLLTFPLWRSEPRDDPRRDGPLDPPSALDPHRPSERPDVPL